jgi:6-pyruvoyl-tetrahydropterin synthase
MESSKI